MELAQNVPTGRGGTGSHWHQGETEETEGWAKKEKAALHFPLLKYSEERSEKPLKEAQITLEITREAGFQRTAENEDQQHQGGQLSPVVDQAKASPHWII